MSTNVDERFDHPNQAGHASASRRSSRHITVPRDRCHFLQTDFRPSSGRRPPPWGRSHRVLSDAESRRDLSRYDRSHDGHPSPSQDRSSPLPRFTSIHSLHLFNFFLQTSRPLRLADAKAGGQAVYGLPRPTSFASARSRVEARASAGLGPSSLPGEACLGSASGSCSQYCGARAQESRLRRGRR